MLLVDVPVVHHARGRFHDRRPQEGLLSLCCCGTSHAWSDITWVGCDYIYYGSCDVRLLLAFTAERGHSTGTETMELTRLVFFRPPAELLSLLLIVLVLMPSAVGGFVRKLRMRSFLRRHGSVICLHCRNWSLWRPQTRPSGRRYPPWRRPPSSTPPFWSATSLCATPGPLPLCPARFLLRHPPPLWLLRPQLPSESVHL